MKKPKSWEKIYRHYQEQINYILFGCITTIVSVGSFHYFIAAMKIDPLIANVISWILAVLTAYITNRIWVFHSQNHGIAACAVELLKFCGGRLLTLGIEEGIIYIFITQMGLNSLMIKLAAQIIVVLLNYIFSKRIIFR